MHNNPLSTAEVSALLRKSPSAVARMANRGELQPLFKSPGRTGGLFFDPAVISAYVAEQEAKENAAHATAGEPA